MRLVVPVLGIFVAAGWCCCCGGADDFVEQVRVEMAKQGVQVPGAEGGGLPGMPSVTTGGSELRGDLSGFPVYAGAVLQAQASVAGVTSANFEVSGATPDALVDFYASYAKENGWTEVARANAGGTSTFTSTKGDKMFNASATAQGEQVWLTLAMSPGM
jgi:hypothetical protein